MGALVTSILGMPGDLVQRVREAEQSGHLPSGTADDLAEARSASGIFFEKVARLGRELGLESLDREIRGYGGRPSAALWTTLADAIATEIQRESPRRVWPMVEDLLRPLVDVRGNTFRCDGPHIRRRVLALRAKRRSQQGIQASEKKRAARTTWVDESTEMGDGLWAEVRATALDVTRGITSQ